MATHRLACGIFEEWKSLFATFTLRPQSDGAHGIVRPRLAEEYLNRAGLIRNRMRDQAKEAFCLHGCKEVVDGSVQCL